MNSAKVSSFVLWLTTAAAATGLVLSNQPAATQPVPHISAVNSIVYDQGKLLEFLHPAPTKQDTPKAASGSYKLLGIAHSSIAGDSRALIEDGTKAVKHYAEGDQLPNGEKIQRIEKRSIRIQANTGEQTLSLPALDF